MADTGHPEASGADGKPRFTSNVLGFAAMSLGMGALVSVDGLVKQIGNELHPVEIVFFRNFFGLVALAPLMLRRGARLWYTRNLKLHAGRGLIHAAAMLCWFWALLFVPLAEATAISFMLPIFATLGAILFLAEPSRGGRWLAVGLGFAGMLIIIRPGFEAIGIGMLLVIASSIGAGTSKVMTKVLVRTDDPATIVAYLTLFITVFSFIPSLFVWRWPSMDALWMLGVIGALGVLGHGFMTWSYRLGEITAVEPAYFTRLIWAALIGFFVFREVPGIWTWAGAAVIVAGAVWLIQVETKEARAKARASVGSGSATSGEC